MNVTDPERLHVVSLSGLVALRMATGDHAPNVVDAAVMAALSGLLTWRVAGGRAALPRGVLAVVALALTVFIASAAASWHPWISFLALPAAVGPLLAFVAAAITTSTHRDLVLAGVAAGGVINASAGLIQRFVTWPDALSRQAELGLPASVVRTMMAGRPPGLSVSPDLFGALSLAALFASSTLVVAHRGPARALAGLAAVVAFAGVAVARSAGVALALGIGLAVVAVLKSSPRRRPLALGALVLAPLFVLALGRGVDALRLSAHERLLNWSVALDVFKGAPLVGVGLYRYAPAYAATRPPEANVTLYAHSTVAQWLAELGLFGLLLLVVVIAGLAFLLVRAREGTPALDDAILGAGALALLSRCVFDYDGQIAQTATTVAALGGLAVAPLLRAGARPVFPLVAIAPAVLGAAGLTLALAVLDRAAALEPFERGSAPADDDDDARLADYAASHPGAVTARAVRAERAVRALAMCGESPSCEGAAADARRAVDDARAMAHPSPLAYLATARLDLIEGRVDDALLSLAGALALDPGFAAAHALRFEIAVRTGHGDVDAFRDDAKRWLHPSVLADIERRLAPAGAPAPPPAQP